MHQQERDLCDAWPNAAQPAATMEEALRRMSETAIDYTTHILIGVKKSGEMTVLAQWPRVPRQADVDHGSPRGIATAPAVVLAVRGPEVFAFFLL